MYVYVFHTLNVAKGLVMKKTTSKSLLRRTDAGQSLVNQVESKNSILKEKVAWVNRKYMI